MSSLCLWPLKKTLSSVVSVRLLKASLSADAAFRERRSELQPHFLVQTLVETSTDHQPVLTRQRVETADSAAPATASTQAKKMEFSDGEDSRLSVAESLV